MSNDWWKHPLDNQADILDPFVTPDGPGPASGRAPQKKQTVKVELPNNLYIPPGAQSLDIRRAADVAAGTSNALFMTFQAPLGAAVRFTHYAVFSDGTLAANQLFVPRKQGKRVFPYHGDPGADGLGNFAINLGLGPDLSNINLIQCDLRLNPSEKIQWFLTNSNAVAIGMGVRMVGYIDYTQERINDSVGG